MLLLDLDPLDEGFSDDIKELMDHLRLFVHPHEELLLAAHLPHCVQGALHVGQAHRQIAVGPRIVDGFEHPWHPAVLIGIGQPEFCSIGGRLDAGASHCRVVARTGLQCDLAAKARGQYPCAEPWHKVGHKVIVDLVEVAFIALGLVFDHAGWIGEIVRWFVIGSKGKVTGGIDQDRHIIWRGHLHPVERTLDLGNAWRQVESAPFGVFTHPNNPL